MVEAIMQVLTAILTWFGTALTTATAVFYNTSDNSLTFVGLVTLITFGIGVITLVLGWIKGVIKGY